MQGLHQPDPLKDDQIPVPIEGDAAMLGHYFMAVEARVVKTAAGGAGLRQIHALSATTSTLTKYDRPNSRVALRLTVRYFRAAIAGAGESSSGAVAHKALNKAPETNRRPT